MKKLIFYTCLLLISISASAQVPGYVPTNGLVGYWPFNGNANDVSGYGNNGSPGSGVTLTFDRFGSTNKAFNFSGNGNIGLLNLPTTGTQDFTIAGWLRTNHTNGRKGIICWGQDSPNSSTYLFINTSNKLAFDLAYNGGPESPVVITDNQWHFVLVTNTSGLMQLYLDGNISGTSLMMSPNINGNNKSIGANITNSGSDNFIGDLDDFGIWNRALTQSEITAYYNSQQQITSFTKTPNFKWAKGVGGVYSEDGLAICNDSSRNVFVTGKYSSTAVSFGSIQVPTPYSDDIFVAKYDKKGNAIWVKTFGGSNSENYSTDNDLTGANIISDNNGNIYVSGSFLSDTLLIGTTKLPNAGLGDFFIAKYDNSGNLLWAKKGGGNDFDYVFGMTTDINGNVIVSGRFSSTSISFGSTTLVNSGANDAFIVKYSSTGSVIWAKRAGSTGDEIFHSVTSDNNNNIYVTGWYNSISLTIGSTALSNSGGIDILVAKYDANGNVIWAKRVGGIGDDYSRSILNDASGNILIGGGFTSSSLTVGTNVLSNSGGKDILIVKFDASGNVVSSKKAGGLGDEYITKISKNANGNTLISGNFTTSDLYLDTNKLTNSGGKDIFFSEADNSGNFLWAKKIGGANDDILNDFSVDINGNANLTGNFNSPTLSFDYANVSNHPLSNGLILKDIFIAHISTIYNNEILQNQVICYNSIPDNISGSDKVISSASYKWIQANANLIYTNAIGINNLKDYQPSNLSESTWYKRVIQNGSIKDTSNAIKIEVIGKPISVIKVNSKNQCFKLNQFEFIDSSKVLGNGTIGQNIWDFGDGTTSLDKNPIKSYSQSGTYNVKLRVFTNYLCSDSSLLQVKVFENQTTKISFDKTTQCLIGNAFILVDSTKLINGSIASRVWNFGDGTQSTIKNPIKNYTKSGLYTIKLLTITDNGCIDSASISVKILKSPSAGKVVGQATNLLLNTPYNYIVNQQLNHNYEWIVDNGVIASGQSTNSLSVQWLTNGQGSLKCILTNSDNCTDTAVLNVNVGPTGINDIKNSNIKIYPNPTNNIINIEGLNKKENNSIQIFDMQGKLVITKTINEKGTIDLSELNKGVYVIKIGELAQRIVKM